MQESEITDIEVDEGYAELEESQDITVPAFNTEATCCLLTPPATSTICGPSVTSSATCALLTQSQPAHVPRAHGCEFY